MMKKYRNSMAKHKAEPEYWTVKAQRGFGFLFILAGLVCWGGLVRQAYDEYRLNAHGQVAFAEVTDVQQVNPAGGHRIYGRSAARTGLTSTLVTIQFKDELGEMHGGEAVLPASQYRFLLEKTRGTERLKIYYLPEKPDVWRTDTGLRSSETSWLTLILSFIFLGVGFTWMRFAKQKA
jgi:hypothetical protein